MSKFLQIPDEALTPLCLHKQALFYILEKFHPNLKDINYLDGEFKGNELKIMESLFEKSNHQLRIYGSPKELLENVEKFKNFPESHRFFEIPEETYQTPPTIFYSLKNEKFICKSDLFVILQNLVHYVSEYFRIEVLSMIAFFLKTKEEKVLRCFDFVKFDERVFGEIEMEVRAAIQASVKENDRNLKTITTEFSNLPFDKIVEKFKNLTPESFSTTDVRRDFRIRTLLKNNTLNPETFPTVVSVFYTQSKVLIQALKKVIQKRPKWFGISDRQKYSNPITVRLFEDVDQKIGVDQKFVMKAELFEAITVDEEKEEDYQLLEEENEDLIDTMSYEDVLRKYGARIQKVEFIRTPIHRTQHRAVPIREFDTNGYCILAVDGLLEFLKSMILGGKIFQKTSNFKALASLCEPLEHVFKTDLKTPYFIGLDAVEFMIQSTRELYEDVKIQKTPEVKEIRNAKKDGFTVLNLKNELAHLGLTTTFPEIQNHADVVYSEVVKKKKEEYLRTCDLMDAVEHCQLICIMNRVPKLKTFLHNQKGCHRVYGLKCEDCDKIQNSQKTSDVSRIQKSSEDLQKTSQLENLQKEVSQLKLDHEKLLENNKKLQQKTEEFQKKIQEYEEFKKSVSEI